MEFKNSINVNSKQEFIEFIEKLRVDNKENSNEWENQDITSYLGGIASWAEDMDGYYENMNLDVPEIINWNFIATLFYIGKIYE